jgi:hypothetical protein
MRCSGHGTRRPDQRAMGQAGAAAAHRQEAGPATEVEQTPVDRRDPLADQDRRAVAGCAGPLWSLADGVWAVSALAARRHLAADPHRPAGSGRRQGADQLGGQRGHHHHPGPPARRRARKGGTATRRTGRGRHRAGRSRPWALPGWAELQAAPGGRGWPAALVDRGHRRPGRRQPQFEAVLHGIRVPRLGPGRPRTRPGRVLADKADSSRANRAWLRCPGIRAVIPEKDDQAAHRRARVTGVAGHRPSTRPPTSCATRWRAGSTGSSGTGRWPLAMTSSPSATRPACASPRSTSGYDF